jgi:uncharacterized delta-60 repeat protein
MKKRIFRVLLVISFIFVFCQCRGRSIPDWEGKTCIPDCEGKECGNDGCGGSCGTCSSGYTCKNSVCVPSSFICWDKTYGGSSRDRASSIQQTTDGGYVVAGYTSSKGAGDYDFWVIKLKANGDIIWDKTYGGSSHDEAYSIQQTTDGGYVVAGETSSKGAGEADFWVIKLDPNGDIIWDKTYGGSSHDQAGSIQQTTDGGYVVAGETFSKGAGEADFWVIKLDPNGDIIWDKTYGGSSRDRASSIQQTTDGGYVVAGAGNSDFWVIKLDPNGDIIWDKTYGGSSRDVALSIQQTTDGGYVVAGYIESKVLGKSNFWVIKFDFWVIKLDPNGEIIWDNGGSSGDWASSIQQTTDGGYVVAGDTYSKGAGGDDFWVIKLDPNGDIIWDKTYGGSSDDWASSIQQTTDGGYVVAGYTSSKGAGVADFWVIKLDPNGDICGK